MKPETQSQDPWKSPETDLPPETLEDGPLPWEDPLRYPGLGQRLFATYRLGLRHPIRFGERVRQGSTALGPALTYQALMAVPLSLFWLLVSITITLESNELKLSNRMVPYLFLSMPLMTALLTSLVGLAMGFFTRAFRVGDPIHPFLPLKVALYLTGFLQPLPLGLVFGFLPALGGLHRPRGFQWVGLTLGFLGGVALYGAGYLGLYKGAESLRLIVSLTSAGGL